MGSKVREERRLPALSSTGRWRERSREWHAGQRFTPASGSRLRQVGQRNVSTASGTSSVSPVLQLD